MLLRGYFAIVDSLLLVLLFLFFASYRCGC